MQQQATKAQGDIPFALANFEQLPDSADVRLPVVAALYACSFPTIWRGVKSGRIPAPRKRTPGCTTWNVGELRKARSE